ncbi:MAG: PspC domain-containing protein [Calditrichaeota bacterium]|nr:PspC domain-containing protein [Calditrichota bacterium]
MKDTIAVNLGNRVFLFSQEAHLKFELYYDILKRHVTSYDNAKEAMETIDFDIADMLHRFLKTSKKTIELDDVEKLIVEFGYSDQWDKRYKKTEVKNSDPGKRKFYLNTQHKILAGVCAGLADYFRIELQLVRILFVLFTIFFPPMIIFYIIAWLVSPSDDGRSTTFDPKINTEQIKPALNQTGNILLKIIGIFLMFIGIATLFGYLVGFQMIHEFTDFQLYQIPVFEGSKNNYFWMCVIAIITIPFISILLIGIKFIWSTRFPDHTFSSLIIIWIVSLLSVGYFASEIVPETDEGTFITASHTMKIPSNHRLTIETGFDRFSDKFQLFRPEINLISTDDSDEIEIRTRTYARGRNRSQAKEHAEMVSYQPRMDSNSLYFENHFTLNENGVIRDQRLEIDIYIPNGINVLLKNYNSRFITIDNWSGHYDRYRSRFISDLSLVSRNNRFYSEE